MAGAQLASSALVWLEFIEREMLLFATFWFVLGAVDDFAVDLLWIGLKLRGKLKEASITDDEAGAQLRGEAAILIAAWQEQDVIAHTVRHALDAWEQCNYTLYVGCYANDPATVRAAMGAAVFDSRVRVVIHDHAGPTTKADCLNRLYSALCLDERRSGRRYAFIVLHDSEDMVHRAELAIFDKALQEADYVQLPVRPEPQATSRWVSGHYCDEFAEAHGKGLVVRDALGVGLPAAGVGCAFSRMMLDRIALQRQREGYNGPFACECLTEDYELGLLVERAGGRSRFLRVRDAAGELVATRAYFPGSLQASVRQKSRWILGIAFQSWDRLGWGHPFTDGWMVLRDRRGPLAALVMAISYAVLLLEAGFALAQVSGVYQQGELTPLLRMLLTLCGAALAWRIANRFAFTTAEYGIAEGVLAVMRVPVANVIAIMAGRRALGRYIQSLRGSVPSWDKTVHDAHPAHEAVFVKGTPG